MNTQTLQMGAGTMSRQRTVQPGQGLVGSIATRADGAACIVPQPSNEPAFCAEVDLPPASGTDKGSGNSRWGDEAEGGEDGEEG